MKFVVFGILAIATSVASATVQTYKWTCTGHELVRGGTAKPAAITINATENVIAKFGNPWNFDISFDGAKEPLYGLGKLCGLTLDTDIKCIEGSPSSVGSFELASRCSDKKAHDVPPYRWTGAKIVMSADQTRGRFHCSSGRTHQAVTVELSDCSAK